MTWQNEFLKKSDDVLKDFHIFFCPSIFHIENAILKSLKKLFDFPKDQSQSNDFAF